MSQRKATPPPASPPLQVGQRFNPRHEICDFYPPDIVGRKADLTDGQKRLYERAVRWAGKNSCFWYSFEKMAAELGKSPRQVKRDMAVLEGHGLIERQRRGRRVTNLYRFLYHPMFDGDGTSTAHHFESEVPDLRGEVTSMVENERGEVTPTSQESCKSYLNYVRESSSAVLEVQEADDDETRLSQNGENKEPGAIVDLVEIAARSGAGEDDPLMGADPLPAWFLQAAAEKIHASKCKRGCGTVNLMAYPRPDLVFTAKIVEPWRGKGTPALVDWILSTVERRLGPKGTSTGPLVYGLFLKDSQACAENWLPDKAMSKAVATLLLSRRLAAEKLKAQEQLRIQMETPVPVVEALQTLNAHDPSWQTKFQTSGRSRFLWLIKRKSPEISPAALLGAAQTWRSCSICQNAGIIASASQGNLAFCGCEIGQQEMAERGDGYIAGELARANTTLGSRLVQACRELRMDFAADALCSSETQNEVETAVVVSIGKSLHISSSEPQLGRALEYRGEKRKARIIVAGKAPQPPSPLPANVKPITQADIDRAVAERRRQQASAKEPTQAGSVEFQAIPAVGEIQCSH